LSKADRVYRVENLIFRKNILLSWLTSQIKKKMAKDLRSSEKIASRVGGFFESVVSPSSQCSTLSIRRDALPVPVSEVGRVCLLVQLQHRRNTRNAELVNNTT